MSLPLWERGLKSSAHPGNGRREASLPLWERGLKFIILGFVDVGCLVAPLVGAWIEILVSTSGVWIVRVAPLVGAWIEILDEDGGAEAITGRSPCGSVD